MRLIIADNLSAKLLNDFDKQTLLDLKRIKELINNNNTAEAILLFEYVFLNDHNLKLHHTVLSKLMDTVLKTFRFLKQKNELSSVDTNRYYQTICNIVIATGIKTSLSEVHEALADKKSCKVEYTFYSARAMHYYLAWRSAEKPRKQILAKKLDGVEALIYYQALQEQISQYDRETRYHTKQNLKELILSLKYVSQRLAQSGFQTQVTTLCQQIRQSNVLKLLKDSKQSKYLAQLSEINRQTVDEVKTESYGDWYQQSRCLSPGVSAVFADCVTDKAAVVDFTACLQEFQKIFFCEGASISIYHCRLFVFRFEEQDGTFSGKAFRDFIDS